MAAEIITQVRKSKGIQDLVRGYTPGKVEEEIKPDFPENKLAEVVASYENILNSCEYSFTLEEQRTLRRKIKLVLKPVLIKSFIYYAHKYSRVNGFYFATSIFINQLIRNSYQAGFNDFSLDIIYNHQRYCLGLTGEKKRPIKLNIQGNVFYDDLRRCQNVEAEIHGDCDSFCGHYCRNVKIVCYGSAGYGFGERSRESRFTVFGDVVRSFAKGASDSMFEIHGSLIEDQFVPELNIASRAENITFQIHNDDTLEKIIEALSRKRKKWGHKVYFRNKLVAEF